MHRNIYYVGNDHAHPNSLRRQTTSPPSDTLLSHPSRHPKKHSSSLSSPKTERSAYVKSIQSIRSKSPVIQALRGALRRSSGQQSAVQPQSESPLPSAFEFVSMKHPGTPFPGVEKFIRFRKVEQPQAKRVCWKAEISGVRAHQFTAMATSTKAKVEAFVLSTGLGRVCKQQNPTRATLCQRESQQVVKSLMRYYVCTACYSLNKVEDKENHKDSCLAPKGAAALSLRWSQLVEVLQEIEQKEQNNSLFRLIDRMKNYIAEFGNELAPRQGVLYSEKLGQILGLREETRVEGVVVVELFWLIEVLGDGLQTSCRDVSESLVGDCAVFGAW